MKPRSCCVHHQTLGVTSQVRAPCRWIRVLEVLEIVLCLLCSIVTWAYTAQNGLRKTRPYEPVDDSQDSQDQLTAAGSPPTGFAFPSSPGLMLFCCFVFGCCVSSFTQRRQRQNPFQFVVYLVLLSGAALVGYWLRADPNLVLLGYLPFATCAAMAISVSGHGAYRRLRPEAAAPPGDEEKAQPGAWMPGDEEKAQPGA